jgi:hypothetical protein
MIFFFLILSSFDLFIPLVSASLLKRSEQKNTTCLLPFVTKPCINDGQNLFCTLSLDSSERNNTCNLSSVSLIFTTSHFELFIIPQYYNQFILIDKYFITKLIFEPDNISNGTFEYLHWPMIRISSIEIPVDIHEFIIIHDMHYVDITRTQNQYWHVQIWPTKHNECQRTVFQMYNITTKQYACPYHYERRTVDACGVTYACLDGIPCYLTGHRQLVCQIDVLRSSTKFQTFRNISQYEKIFVDLLYSNQDTLHTIELKTFMINQDSLEPMFITKLLVVIISSGIIQVSATFFSSYEDFHVRIEHNTCNDGQFILDILDDTEPSTFVDLFDYTTTKTGGIGCRLDKNE